MSEKELLSQLNNLKNIKPDIKWKENNREILLNQILGAKETVKISWFKALGNIIPQQLARQLSQPVFAVVLIMMIVFGGGIVSINAARDTKPGDSLYIAKVISEKARVTLTFNEKEKTKLNLEFASNRAKEISQVLAEPNNNGKKQARVEKLVKNFKKEINTVKTRLEKISEDEGVIFFGANLGKSDERMEISLPDDTEPADSGEETTEGPADSSEEELEVSATSTTSEDITKGEEEKNDVTKVLEEAEELLDKKDYNGTFSKLTEANNIIDQAGQDVENEGEVVEENIATTTEENLEQGEVKGVSEEAEENKTVDDNKEEVDTTGSILVL